MIRTSLRDLTICLLKNRPVWLTYKLIETDTTIPEGWLKAFAKGRIEDPGVNRVETLKAYLESKVN